MPGKLTGAVQRIWGNQKRFLSWNGEICKDPIKVTSSIPQGDALSPWALNSLLAAPMRDILSKIPRTVLAAFLDDRSWGSATAAECKRVFGLWHLHTKAMGLRENENKTQITHKTAKGRRQLLVHFPHDKLVKHLRALGASLGMGKADGKELERINKAMKAADKIHAAPVCAAKRAFTSAMSATSKAAYGWLSWGPALSVVSKLEVRLKRAGYNHLNASVPLAKLVVGHARDVRFTAGMQALSAAHRAVKLSGEALLDWNCTAGPAKRLRKFLSGLNWRISADWTWEHASERAKVCLDPRAAEFQASFDQQSHAVRESWRRMQWNRFLTSRRRETPLLANFPYDSARVRRAREVAKTAGLHGVAVLTGALISPQCFEKMKQGENAQAVPCPFCGHQSADLRHVLWSCPKNGKPQGLTAKDPLQERLAWPYGESAAQDRAVLQHAASVRRRLLQLRYPKGNIRS